MNRSPHEIILKPVLTEKSVALGQDSKFVFFVDTGANQIEIKQAIEAIYNAGKKKDKNKIEVLKVNIVKVHGKTKRVNFKSSGKRPDRKKAIITLAPGQILEGFGV